MFQKIVNFGTSSKNSETENRLILTSNISAFITILMLLFFSSVYYLIGNKTLISQTFYVIPAYFLYIGVLFLNKFGKNYFASLLYVLTDTLVVIILIFLGQGDLTNVHYFFFLVGIVSVMYFKIKQFKTVLFLVLLNGSLFVVSYLYGKNFVSESILIMDSTILAYLSGLFKFSVFFTIFIIVWLAMYISYTKELRLENMNGQLNNEVQKQVNENRKKDKLIFQQSKLAAMGDMINNIAHQWRQPLSEINSIVMVIDYYITKDGIKNKDIESSLDKIETQTRYMSHTIDNFRNYFMPDKVKEGFSLSSVLDNCMDIMKDGFEKKGINIDIDIIEDKNINGYMGEFIQVLITILNNSKDALVERSIEKKHISITIDKNIVIQDNAGGINKDIMDKIFDPYFTTKHSSQGTGIGLYMVKMIIEKSMAGTIKVSNAKNGAKFTIEV